jgi:molybdopterin synthase catalytic subunit
VSVIHRVGALLPSDQIVFVGVASSHRAAAFQAADFLMDYLKTHALLWKRVESDGQRSWVETKDSDERALQRWTQSPTPP